MIDKITNIFEYGHQMTLASKAGVRQIHIQDGTILDPLGEITTYLLEPAYDGKITMRFYNGNNAMGYVQHRKEGTWVGNNRSSWMEMNPVDRSIWVDLRKYVPKTDNKVNPHIEPIRDVTLYEKQVVKYDWEPTSGEAVVLLIHHTNSRYEEMLPLLTTEGKDLIVEIDALAIAGRAAVVKRVKELAPQAYVVEHDVQFGLGYLLYNCHKNVFDKYNKAAIFTDELIIAPNCVEFGYNLLAFVGNNSQAVVNLLGPAFDPEELQQGEEFSYKVSGPNLGGYFMTKDVADIVTPYLKEYAVTFLQSKYESRPHHSIRKWLKEKLNVYIPDAATGIKEVISQILTFAQVPIYSPVNPRAVKSGRAYSNKGDSRRKKFTEAK